MKELLRRIPGLVTTHRRARLLFRVFYEGWWLNPAQLYEHLHRSRHWDFETPFMLERNRRILAAISERRGTHGWGDALEVGCADGVFTLELAPRCRSVTACDISIEACTRARERCAAHGNVRVEPLDIARAPLLGSYDIVFAVDLFDELHSRGRIQRVARKLAQAVCPGGLLVFSGCRLPAEMRSDRLAHWLLEGADNALAFFASNLGWRLVYEDWLAAPGFGSTERYDLLLGILEKHTG